MIFSTKFLKTIYFWHTNQSVLTKFLRSIRNNLFHMEIGLIMIVIQMKDPNTNRTKDSMK